MFACAGTREDSAVQQAQRRSAVFLSFKSPIPCLPLRWEQQSKLLPTVAGIPASKVSKWSTDEVHILSFVSATCRSRGLYRGRHSDVGLICILSLQHLDSAFLSLFVFLVFMKNFDLLTGVRIYTELTWVRRAWEGV